jgi:hypothetical protein
MQGEDAGDEYDYVGMREEDLQITNVPEPPGKLVIPISRAGMMAGTIASSVGYTATNSVMNMTSVSAGAMINGIGYLVEKTAGAVIGPMAETAIHGARIVFAASTAATIAGNAQPAALLVSAVAGTSACVTVTAAEMAAVTVKKIAENTASAAGYIVGKVRGYADGSPTEVIHDS